MPLCRIPRRFLPVVLFVITPFAPGLFGAANGATTPTLYQCKPGPWGHISYQLVYLSPPDWILEQFPMPRPQERWCFPNATSITVSEFLTKSGLEPTSVIRLCSDPRSRTDQEGVFTIFPTEQDIESLPPPVREKIYHELAKSPLNPFHAEPIVVPDGNVDAWVAGTGLPEPIVSLIRKVAYKDGGSTLFSDFRIVLSQTQSDDQARQWVKILTRTRAVVATLTIEPSDNLPALKKYWSADFHRPDALPLLDAVATEAPGGHLDLIHLLPPFARQLAYSFTTPDIERSGQTPNCHWTSLNFFNYTRQNIYLDLKFASSRVVQGYEKVSEPYAYGDVLFFLDPDGGAYHSCVYLADNLVFTKNGENTMMPWILTRLEDVKQLYFRSPGEKIEGFRRRWTEMAL